MDARAGDVFVQNVSGCTRFGEGPFADLSRSAAFEAGLVRSQKLRARSVERAVVDRRSSFLVKGSPSLLGFCAVA